MVEKEIDKACYKIRSQKSRFFCLLKKTAADPNLVLFAVIGEEDSRERET